VPLVSGLRRSGSGLTDTANFAVSDTGTLVLVPAVEGSNPSTAGRVQTTLVWVDRDGREEELSIRPDDYTMVRLSPDGTKAALVIGSAPARDTLPSIWIYELETGTLSLLATDPAVHDGPVWSHDGSRIYFRAYELVAGQIVGSSVHAIELATGEVTLVGAGSAAFQFVMPWALSPDGNTLAVINAPSLEDVNLATLELQTGEFTVLLEASGQQNQPSFSHDGAWVVYSDTPIAGAGEIILLPFPAVSRTRIPVGPGVTPLFSRDGSELFYSDGQGIVALAVNYQPTLRFGLPRRIIELDGYLGNLYGRTWDRDPNGERFLLIREPAVAGTTPGTDSKPARVDVVLNWFEELKVRVPVDR
jgi:hypothetical protein